MSLPQLGGARAQVMRPDQFTPLPFTAISTRTAQPVAKGTQVVRLVATEDCFVAIGDSTVQAGGSAGPGRFWLPAGLVELWQVSPNASYIAVVQDQAGGVLYITECN